MSEMAPLPHHILRTRDLGSPFMPSPLRRIYVIRADSIHSYANPRVIDPGNERLVSVELLKHHLQTSLTDPKFSETQLDRHSHPQRLFHFEQDASFPRRYRD